MKLDSALMNRSCRKQYGWAWLHYTPVSFLRSSDGALFVQEFENVAFVMQ